MRFRMWNHLLIWFVSYCLVVHGDSRQIVHATFSQTGVAETTVEIPFKLTKWNNISVPVKINDSIDVKLMFHTAVNSVSLIKVCSR